MDNDVYHRLARHLDNLPAGFPPTESGVEIKILKKLFLPEEARISAFLTMKQEPAASIAARAGMDEEKAALLLENMSKKGLIFRKTKKGEFFYMAAQFVIGIWEYHVNDLDRELIEYFNSYVPHLIHNSWAKQKTQQLRVVPVNQSVDADIQVAPYEQAEKIIQDQSGIVLAPCICRKEHKMMGKGCGAPEETCLIFSTAADYYKENGLGRRISRQEALDLLKEAQKAGLVLQPSNAKKAVNICMCCGCCCQILKNIKALPAPARAVRTNYYARVDENDCTACFACVQRCPMDAISMDETAQINLLRCIGCGLCVSGCDSGAIRLMSKPENERYEPPDTLIQTYIRLARERGRLKRR